MDEYEARLPLLIASTGGFLQIVECLLSANADVNRCRTATTTARLVAGQWRFGFLNDWSSCVLDLA